VTHPITTGDLSALKFERVWVREASFLDGDSVDMLPPGQERSFRVLLSIRQDFSADGKRAYVRVGATLEPEAPGGEEFRKLSAAVEGVFALSVVADPEMLKKFASLQAPVLLLPYLRQLISSLTAQSRMGTVVIPPINMVEVLHSMQGSIEQSAARV
jgi:preprotein translocase subunit SecB